MDTTEKSPDQYDRDILKIFAKRGLYPAKMIGCSKSAYWDKYPRHFTVFNANVVSPTLGKVWWGDLDLSTKDAHKLRAVAEDMKEILYVLREMDGRFERERDKPKVLVSKAIWSTEKGVLKNK